MDTGASAHMTPSSSTLDAMEPYSGNHKVLVGNGNVLPISHIGSHRFNSTLHLLDILVVPGLQKNLISISKLTRDFPVDAIFTNNSFLLQKRDTKEILAQGRH